MHGQPPCTLRSRAEGPGHRAGSARLTLLTSCPGQPSCCSGGPGLRRPWLWALTHPNSGIH